MIKTFFNFIIAITFFLVSYQCKKEKSAAENTDPYFEGVITLSESRGLYGSLAKVHTTYTISENFMKREQKMGGINSVFDAFAGIIVDLEKDSVVLYYNDNLSGVKIRHSTTIKDFKTNSKYRNLPQSAPSSVDYTFRMLQQNILKDQVKDSTVIKGFKCDYTAYNDSLKIFKQEVFDTKKIKIKREILQMVFENLPKEINFPLKSNLRTTLTDLSNDTIISGQQTRIIDAFLRDKFQTKNEKTDLEKLASNKWVKIGLNVLKKGVDLNIHITTDLSEISERKIMQSEFKLPSIGFKEISDIEEFINQIPVQSNTDFDD